LNKRLESLGIGDSL